MRGARPARLPLVLAAVGSLLLGGAQAPVFAEPAHKAISDPAQYVNPFVGTKPGGPDFGHGGGAGNTFPGADAPFGMLQWSPDTVTHQHGGYHYEDNRIRGFSLTHISGPGCSDHGNIPFLPILGDQPVEHHTFSHANETAAPGSYAVRFDNGIRTELAATQRSGIARFTYPAGQRASLTADAARGFNPASGAITIGANTLSGFTDSGGFCGTGNRYRLYFHATFDQPFVQAGVVGTDGKVDRTRRSVQSTKDAPAAKALVSFGAATVTARVGISYVSLDGAKANLVAEQGSRTFEQVRDGTRATWNELLGRISVTGGTDTQRSRLYTNLYHSLLHPNVFSDVSGEYIGFDRRIHKLPPGRVQHATFSGWDVYRSQVQLVALLAPKEASDIAQSAVNQATQGGYFDRWTVANGGTGVMNGDPMSIIVANMHAFGATDFNTADALQRMVTGSRDPRQRPGHVQYDGQSYIPAGTGGVWGTASTTLEYTSADFAVSQFAARIGDTATHDLFLRRAQNWRSLLNSGIKTIQPRNGDGTWPAFTPTQENEYVEGNGAQYSWMVPYNHRGLFDAMGGNAAVLQRLDAFFAELNAGPKKPYAYLGNEPTLNTPWAYAYAGAPYKTQDIVRRALTSIFKPAPDGYVGNDDLGQMASWGVWAALGMYPEAPGRSELVLASPLFPEITITRGNGVTIKITAPQASEANKYVQSLRVNGQTSTRPWVGEDMVRNGGTLDYALGASPNTAWGSAAADAPPSFDVGPAQPRTGPITGLASKCVDVNQGATADGTKVQLWDCDGGTAQQWTFASDGTVRALGKCLDVSNSGTANGTKIQLWQCNGTSAQQWWPKADGGLVSPMSGRCLDVPNSVVANGTQLQIFDCNGTGAQIWRTP
ncbi:GH92 family glycosyl hydrolase [Allokutzneria oryzae]|uniref:GH92 family glycosyl hydrolase n=1 Tax=Allokutzneria oryzae TaxID=1378989 RepID=A0ABV6A7T0_9PSEU